MSLEIKPGVKVILRLKDPHGGLWRSGTIVHVSAVSIVLDLDKYNSDDAGNKMSGNHNFLFDDIIRIDPQ